MVMMGEDFNFENANTYYKNIDKLLYYLNKVRMYMYVCMYVCMYVYMCVSMCVYVCMYVCVCVSISDVRYT